MSVGFHVRCSALFILGSLVGCSNAPATAHSSAASVRAPSPAARPAAAPTDRLKWVRHDLVWPGLRSGASLIYDETRANTLLFGGALSRFSGDDAVAVAKTMIWSGSSWSQPQPAHEPPPRQGAAAVFDGAHKVVLLFGGLDVNDAPLNDTWTWDGSDWTQQPAAAPSPAPTGTLIAAYDAARQRVVLMSSDNASPQVWEWDGASWSNRTPTSGAAPGNVFSAAYSAPAGGVVTVSYDFVTGGSGSTTWLWNGQAWAKLQTAHSAPLGATRLIYDAQLDRVVALPGDTCWRGYQWDGHDWTAPDANAACGGPVPAQPYLGYTFATTYDQARQTTMVVGSDGELDSATWGRKSGATWARLDAGRPSPQVGYGTQRISYDGKRQRLVLVDSEQYGGSIWEYDGSRWQVFADPMGGLAYEFSVASDSARGRTLLVGGLTWDPINQKQNAVSETCEWDGAQTNCASWNGVIPDKTGRSFAGLAFDSDQQRMIIFGGATCFDVAIGSTFQWDCLPELNGTYAWDGVSYTLLDDGGGTAPSPRQYHGMAYDSGRKRVVVFGGTSGSGESNGSGISSYLGDTWEWDGTRWLQAHPAHSPVARFGAGLVYDAHRGRTVLVGGTDLDGILDDVWDWDGNDWVARSPSNSPGAFAFPAMTYDSARQLTVLYGAPGQYNAGGAGAYGDGTLWSLEADPGAGGDGCNSDPECTSGHCVDHVCCDTACGGGDANDCQACSVAAGAAQDGVCAPLAAAHVCRAASGACDTPESCDGQSVACPADQLQPSTTQCRAASGACDVAELCSGKSADCPADQLAPATTVCRAAAGGCDVAEVCSGASVDCPGDAWAAAGTACAAATECAAAASCSGGAATCPAALPVSDGTACAGGSCMAGQCVSAPGDMGTAAPDLSPPSSSPPVTAPVMTEKGCGCAVGGGQPAGGLPLAIGLGLALVLLRQRRRRDA